jgi:hypothetical protein
MEGPSSGKRQRVDTKEVAPDERTSPCCGMKLVLKKVQTGGDGTMERVQWLTGLPLGTAYWVHKEDDDGYHLRSLHDECEPAAHKRPFTQDHIQRYVNEVEEVASRLDLAKPVDVGEEAVRSFMEELVENDPFDAELVCWAIPDPNDPEIHVSLGRLCMHKLFVPFETAESKAQADQEESQQV